MPLGNILRMAAGVNTAQQRAVIDVNGTDMLRGGGGRHVGRPSRMDKDWWLRFHGGRKHGPSCCSWCGKKPEEWHQRNHPAALKLKLQPCSGKWPVVCTVPHDGKSSSEGRECLPRAHPAAFVTRTSRHRKPPKAHKGKLRPKRAPSKHGHELKRRIVSGNQ